MLNIGGNKYTLNSQPTRDPFFIAPKMGTTGPTLRIYLKVGIFTMITCFTNLNRQIRLETVPFLQFETVTNFSNGENTNFTESFKTKKKGGNFKKSEAKIKLKFKVEIQEKSEGFISKNSSKASNRSYIFPETNIALENGWLEY